MPAVGEYHAARARPVRYALFGKPVGMLAHNVVLGQPGRLCGRRSRRRGLRGFRQRDGSQRQSDTAAIMNKRIMCAPPLRVAHQTQPDRLQRTIAADKSLLCKSYTIFD